jgi:putative ABC transport system substrate-binding protein
MDGMRELGGKRLALLKAAAPHVTRVAYIRQQMQLSAEQKDDYTLRSFTQETLAAARSLGLSIFFVNYRRPEEIPAAFSEAVRNGANGVLAPSSFYSFYRDTQFSFDEQARRYKLPVMYYVLGAAENGGMMAYGPDYDDFYRAVPRFIDRILRGAKPSDIPIERPSRFQLIVNRTAAKAIGLTIPDAVLAEANRIID